MPYQSAVQAHGVTEDEASDAEGVEVAKHRQQKSGDGNHVSRHQSHPSAREGEKLRAHQCTEKGTCGYKRWESVRKLSS